MADPKDVRILKADGTWESLRGPPGKGADVKRIEALEQEVAAIKAQLQGLPYGAGPGIEIQ